MLLSQFKIIGAAVGGCAGIEGCEQAPDLIKQNIPKLQAHWQATVYCNETNPATFEDDFANFSQDLARTTLNTLKDNHKFITFGGDHSCAIGTWSAVAEHVGEFGLIWIDAHMDAHTPETSPTGNIHGMPVACLLGHGSKKLTSILNVNPKIKPENIVLMGIRSYEPGEEKLLEKLGVKVYKMQQVQEQGFVNCMQDTYNDFASKGIPYGVSIDLDGLDPSHIQGLGTPVEGGIALNDLNTALSKLDMDQVIGLEIVEYNPVLDGKNHPGLKAIQSVLDSIPG